jgi:hypothetical protein
MSDAIAIPQTGEIIGDAIPPKPAAEAPPEPQPEVKEGKPEGEELSDGIKALLKDRLKGKPAPKEEKKEEKPKEEKPKAEAKPKEEKPPEEKPPEKAKVKVAKKAPVPDIKAIASEAAAAATKEALKAAEAATIKKPPGTPKPTIETEIEQLPEEYREDVPVLREMEKKWPDKYKGLTEKYVKASSRIEAYRANWEKDNPGATFDPDSSEHAAFIEANEVDWNDRDYGRALAAMETETAIESERKKVNEKLAEVEGKLVERELEPTIRARQAEVAKGLIEAIDKDFAGIVEPDGRVNRKEIERLKEVDSFRVDALLAAAGEAARFVDVAERIFHPSGRFKFDQGDQQHLAVAQFLIATEDSIIAGGEETQVSDDGRVFATREEWATLDDRARRRRWRLELQDLVYLKQREQTDLARKRIKEWDDRFEKLVAARGYQKGEKPKDGSGTPAKPKEEKPAAAKPSAPSATDGGKIDTSGQTQIKPQEDFRTKLKQALRGNRVK